MAKFVDLDGKEVKEGDRVIMNYKSKYFSTLVSGIVLSANEDGIEVQTGFGTFKRTKSQEIFKAGG